MVQLSKMTAAVVFLASAGAAAFFSWMSYRALASLPPVPVVPGLNDHEVAGHAPASEHGAASAAGHGGGGGHGAAAAPAQSGHGGGDAAAGGHGAAPAAGGAKAQTGVPLFGVDEVYVNIQTATGKAHSFALKVDLELFEEKSRETLEKRMPVLRSVILETAQLQEYSSLTSLSGKLYFKEALISRLNEVLGGPAVRDLHFASFYLQ